MKIRQIIRVGVLTVFVGLCLQGCSAVPSPTVAPTVAASSTAAVTLTHAATATATLAATATHRPTQTRTYLPTRTPKPTRLCNVDGGWWISEERVETYWTTTPFPMVQMLVGDCEVSSFVLVVYPVQGKLFEAELATTYGAIRTGSINISFDNPAGAGALTIYGEFDSHDHFQGFIMFSKGFVVDGYVLPDVATIPWSGHP